MIDSSRPKRVLNFRIILAMLIAGALGYLISEFRHTPHSDASTPQRPEITVTVDIFRTQLFKFMDEANKIKALVSQGASQGEFASQLVNVKAAYDSAQTLWPPDLSPTVRAEFEQAIDGWDLALKLWRLKVLDSELTSSRNEPAEPDLNGFATFVAYGGQALAFEKYGADSGHVHLRGKTFLPFDQNIRTLLDLAKGHLEVGAKTFSPVGR